MPLLTIFDGALGAAFTASQPFLMTAERVTIDFDVVVTAGPATIQWYMEFDSENPLNVSVARWRRELAEEDVGGGITHMPKVVRDFQENGGAGLAVGTHRLSAQFIRTHQFTRLQLRITAGAASVRADVPFGINPVAPV